MGLTLRDLLPWTRVEENVVASLERRCFLRGLSVLLLCQPEMQVLVVSPIPVVSAKEDAIRRQAQRYQAYMQRRHSQLLCGNLLQHISRTRVKDEEECLVAEALNLGVRRRRRLDIVTAR